MRKILKNEVPTSITDQFHISENRQDQEQMHRSLEYYGAKTWNNLLTELKNLTIGFSKINYKISFAKITHFLITLYMLPVTAKTRSFSIINYYLECKYSTPYHNIISSICMLYTLV